MKPISLILAVLLFVAALTWPVAADSKEPTLTISGHVTDSTGAPVVGVSAVLSHDSITVAGTATDTAGFYRISAPRIASERVVLRFSSVAYYEMFAAVPADRDSIRIDVRMVLSRHEIAGIRVMGHVLDASGVSANHATIEASSRGALVPTNPIVSIRQPQISRVGSSHSSQLRINGSSPRYFLNGTSIGYDPNHYGMFPVIPSTVVDRIDFYPEGTPAEYGLPVTIDLITPMRFVPEHHGELNMSTIEVTGTYTYGTDRFFLLGSARKSILDRLVKEFDVSSNRRTLPPTNFRDIFVSSGLKLGPHYSLAADQYYVRDFLSYSTAGASSPDRIENTFQHTQESFVSTRVQALYPGALVRLSLATRTSAKEYRASPQNTLRNDLVRLKLEENRTSHQADIDARFELGDLTLAAGNQAEYIARRDISLTQKNWNFLPPFSNSDNPFVYQQALNEEYGAFSQQGKELNDGLFTSVSWTVGPVRPELGVRYDYFSNLATTAVVSYRAEVALRLTPRSRLGLFYGTFAENPANNILEPYQVLVHAWLNRLDPIRHEILRVDYSTGPLKLGLFRKAITHTPVVSPDFESVRTSNGEISPTFLKMTSSGRASFYGGTISLDLKNVVRPGLDFYASYAHTHAYRVDEGVTIPYELNAPHRLVLALDFKASSRFSFGAEANVRSGYPYTPCEYSSGRVNQDRYAPDYYRSSLENQNSSTFPASAALNLTGVYAVNRVEVFFSVSNVTNRGNAIINSAHGYIYDAGILPSLGMRWRF